jgi:hypothetical protein
LAILLPLSVTGYALLLCLATGASSELAVLAAVSGLLSALYLAGLAGMLHPAAVALFWGGLMALVLGAWLGRGRPGFWARFLSPGAVVFLGLSLAFALGCSQITLQFWDEFSHWAVATKELLVTNALPGAQGALIFKEYPVGVNLVHYWAAVNIADREAVYYLGHFLLLAAPLAAFFGGLSWRRPWWVLGMLAAAVLVMFTLSVYVCSLMVDVALGLFLGAGLFLATMATRGALSRGQVLLFVPLLMALPMIKSTGYLFAWMVVVALLVAQGKGLLRGAGAGGRGRLATALVLAAVVAAPMASHLSWGQRIRALDISPAFKTSPITVDSALQAFSRQASERHRLTRANFAQALWDTPLANYTFEPERSLVQAAKESLGLPDWVRPPQLGLMAWLVLAGLLFAAALIRQREPRARRRVVMVLVLFLGFGAFYVFGLLLLYLFTFSEFEGPRLASYARYVNTMLMPMMLAGLALAAPQAGDNGHGETGAEPCSPGRRAAYWVCLGLALAGVLAQGPSWEGASKWRVWGDASEERSYITPLTEQVKRLTPPTARVFIIYQRSAGRGFHIARYEIAPRPANKWFFSLGAPYYEGDIWTEPLTPEKWSRMLIEERFDHVFLERADEHFWSAFGELFPSAPDPRRYVVFKVTEGKDGLVRLKPVGAPNAPDKVWWGPGEWR